MSSIFEVKSPDYLGMVSSVLEGKTIVGVSIVPEPLYESKAKMTLVLEGGYTVVMPLHPITKIQVIDEATDDAQEPEVEKASASTVTPTPTEQRIGATGVAPPTDVELRMLRPRRVVP